MLLLIVGVISFVANLIIRHPQCKKLIHRETKQSVDNVKSIKNNLKKDPYLEEESDPLETRALKSSLWELELIMKFHYDENIRNYCKLFKSDILKK